MACKNDGEKAAFLGAGNNESASNSNEDLNILSSIKTDLLRNGRDLLATTFKGVELFCPVYDNLDTTERLDFWSKLIYKVTKNSNLQELSLIGCDEYDFTDLETAFCVVDSLNTSLVLKEVSILFLLSEELSVQTKDFKVCKLK
jgi:hypothetical protein